MIPTHTQSTIHKKIYSSADVSPNKLIPITIVAGRGLIFDIQDIILLREKYHICGVLGGVLPQFPQQNQFLGLPLILMPEEVKYIVEEVKAGYLVDDPKAHEFSICTFTQEDVEQLNTTFEKEYKAQNIEHKVQALLMRRRALERNAAGKGKNKSKKKNTKDQQQEPDPNSEIQQSKQETETNEISPELQEFINHGFDNLKITEEETKMVRNIADTAGRFHEIPTSTMEKPDYLPAYPFYQDQYKPRQEYDREATIRQAGKVLDAENATESGNDGTSHQEGSVNQDIPQATTTGVPPNNEVAGQLSEINSKAERETQPGPSDLSRVDSNYRQNLKPPVMSAPFMIQPDPVGYEAFKYFHSQKGYNGEQSTNKKVDFYLTPGLRFGGQYVSYPGDPLRYHSHHIVTGKGYDEKFRIMDIIGGGRLGTTVKKTWFVGAKNDNDYHGFCIEWSTFG